MNETVQRRGPGSRAGGNHPTRIELLRAAINLAETDGLDTLTIGAVTNAAGHAKGTFYVHFDDRTELLVEMHRTFHRDLFSHIAEVVESEKDGPTRARARITSFLDGCRQQVGVRSMLFQARHDPVIADLARQRNEEAAKALSSDIRDKVNTPFETAALLVSATIEVAGRELEAGRRLPRMRSALLVMVPH